MGGVANEFVLVLEFAATAISGTACAKLAEPTAQLTHKVLAKRFTLHGDIVLVIWNSTNTYAVKVLRLALVCFTLFWFSNGGAILPLL